MNTDLHKDLILLFPFWIGYQVSFGDQASSPKLCHPCFKISVSFQKKKTELYSIIDQKSNIILPSPPFGADTISSYNSAQLNYL